MIRFILSDIEGTTTPISFVHDVLFPFATQRLPEFVKHHGHEVEVGACLAEVHRTLAAESANQKMLDGSEQTAVATLLDWSKTDRKHPALKKLQGMIWKDGYASGAFRSIVYPDVPPALRQWKELGLGLGIYSSGSVEAQKLLFRHSDQGDLSSLFGAWFDTAVGAKREAASYQRIASELGHSTSEVLFLSDIEAELDAAQAVDMNTVQLLRPGTSASSKHRTAARFTDISLQSF